MGFRVGVLKGARWFLWLFVAFIFVRGIASFFVSPRAATEAVAEAAPPVVVPADREAPAAFAALFAREYLTFAPGQEADRAARLKPMLLAGGPDAQAGWSASSAGAAQTVLGTWPFRVTTVSDTTWQVTVAARVSTLVPVPAQTADAKPSVAATERTIYLSVPVLGGADGYVVYDYPTVVPAPAAASSLKEPAQAGTVMTDPNGQIRTLLSGFLKAYTAGTAADATYFMEPGAKVEGLAGTQVFGAITELTVRKVDGAVWADALVSMNDPISQISTRQRYTVEVIERDGRWYVKQILQKGA
ncbi:MAG: hypothetical protein K0R39_4762 [Symbiobacteriaceae bacterium]|jgi:hypothetical protein|nr:hypothetical protein [Symbiobacteriaceae bacterium]